MSFSVEELEQSLDKTAELIEGWGLRPQFWSLLDGPAVKLRNHHFDASAWRDHLNVYVDERALPWTTTELELTVPPQGTEELRQILQLAQGGVLVHLVPAQRYYEAGFERESIMLPSGRSCEVATLRGCSQVWSYKSAELLDRLSDFGEDAPRIVGERIQRLDAALQFADDADIRERLLLLRRGYQAVVAGDAARGRRLFGRAAGEAWSAP